MTTIPLAMLIALAAVVLLMIIGLVLWQKRSSSQLSILQNVAKTLEEIEKTMKEQEQPKVHENVVQAEQTTAGIQPEQAAEDLDAQPLEEENEKTDEETDTEKALKAISQIMVQERIEESSGEQPPESDSHMSAPAIDSMGKSGKSYTEEELELLIKE